MAGLDGGRVEQARAALSRTPRSPAVPAVVSDHRETFDRSLWSALTPPAPVLPQIDGDVRTGVAIVGGGILGLSLALHLAERGIDCVLLEADRVGFGASGRNTGFVVPSFLAGRGPEQIAALLGAERGERLSRFVGGSGTVLFDLARRLGIDCAAEQTGWVQPANTAAKFAAMTDRVKRWQAVGRSGRLLDRAETARVTGTTIYHGALIEPTGGQVNPLAYLRGIARAALAAGAALHDGVRVTGLASDAGRWRLTHATGRVFADQVFVTTNALVAGLMPAVRRSLIPARPYQVATQPLDASIRARILPDRNPVADLHHHTFAYRWSPDNRLVTGGLGLFNDAGAVSRRADYFVRRLHQYLPGLPKLEPAYAWNGVVATTPDLLPAVWTMDKGVYAPIGCNGRGIAITTALGAALAAFVATGDEAALPVRIGPPPERRFQPILTFGPSFWLAWSALRDWYEDRHPG